MAEETSTSAPASPKKGKRAAGGVKPKKSKIAPSHPKVSVMVPAAIGALKERGGSSLQAIKKYVSANYKVDADRLAPFIKKYLKGAVESGALLQTKGKGASGSFKLKGTAGAPKAAEARPAKAKKPAAAVGRPKKAPAAKKSPAKSSKKAPAAAAAVRKSPAKRASPKKAVKKPAAAKSPKKAAKPKAPKAKKTKSPAKKAAKK